MDRVEASSKAERGEKAAKLLENETLIAAFSAVSHQIDDEFHKCATTDVATLQALNAESRALTKIQQRLRSFINAGKEAREKLNRA